MLIGRASRRLPRWARLQSSVASTKNNAHAPTFVKPLPSLATETFNWEDPLSLSSQLTEDERALYETARNFAQKELKPSIVQCNREGRFDRGIMRAFGGVGMLGLTVPTAQGGGGAGYVAYGLCARAVEQVDATRRPRL